MLGKTNRLIGAILLVSGTTVGAGMLALPVTTGLAGFIPALLIMLLIWAFMMLTAFYFLEVNLRMPGESNLISMVGKTLGTTGQVISWVFYLLLLYALMTAYLMGCSQILGDLIPIPQWTWALILFAAFALFIYFGTQATDMLNRIFILGMVITYICVVAFGCCKVEPPLLLHFNWNYFLPSLSVVLTTFGYHIIIPTLSTYLEHDVKSLKKAIFIGSLLPLVIYILWQFVVMGIVPSESLHIAAEQGVQVTFFLKKQLMVQWIGEALRLFALCAIVTSLLGVSLSLTDFLSDGLHIKRTHWGKFLIVLLTFCPPLFFTLFYPEGFIAALRYAGIFVVILLALLPALMAWFERYREEKENLFVKSRFKVPGGKPVVLFTILFSIVLLGFELFI